MADKYSCVACRKEVTKTKSDRYRSHSDGNGEPCEMSSVEIPEHVLANPSGKDDAPDVPREGIDFAVCPQCERKVKLTRLGYFEDHATTLRGGERCPVSGVRAKHARRTEDVNLPPVAHTPLAEGAVAASGDVSPKGSPEPTWQEGSQVDWSDLESQAGRDRAMERLAALPDVSVEVKGELIYSGPESVRPAGSSASTESNSPPASISSSSTSGISSESQTPSPSPGTSSDVKGETSAGPAVQFSLAPPLGDGRFLQPFSPFSQPSEWIPPTLVFLQPPEYGGPEKAAPMGDLAKELATKIKETFYSYSNRKTADNRSAQTTLGPSEIGTPCDRRLAMALLGVLPVNAGGDGWAAFVGTCTHAGMAEVYTFADAGTGRYAVELPVFLGTPTVPRGTLDKLDRRDGTVVDWKVMGAYSLKKFKLEGPNATYRTQAHVYGLGAERGGEKVRNVAIVGLPRAGSSLDEMHVWTEKYDRKFAEAALTRVERIADEVEHRKRLGLQAGRHIPIETARTFATGDDCRYCPFHLKNDKEMRRGCPGK